MSKTAIITMYAVVLIVSVVFMYGHGFYQGRNAQITYQSALEIAKNQFSCKMVSK